MSGKNEMSWTAQEHDFPRYAEPPKLRFVVASTPRSGSTLLCNKMWRTGELGAPWEYFNQILKIMPAMADRLDVTDLDAYVRELFATRTSPNGVFSFKIHYSHAKPEYLRLVQPQKFIFNSRGDLVAQAVSFSKALQTSSWTSLMKEYATATYAFDQIFECMVKIQRENLGWRTWFRNEGIKPFMVHYEELVADPDKVVRQCADWLGVQISNDAEVQLPKLDKQGDRTNIEWETRFLEDLQSSSRLAEWDLGAETS